MIRPVEHLFAGRRLGIGAEGLGCVPVLTEELNFVFVRF